MKLNSKANRVENSRDIPVECSQYVSDPHNFGQRVERVDFGGEASYVKPRPIFWEYLFFGEESPVSQFFDKPIGLRDSKIEFKELFFRLQFMSDVYLPSGGVVKEIRGLDKAATSPSTLDWYSYGALIGYSYIFGIHDLHLENLKRVGTGLLPIDVETALIDFKLPCETLLYPMPGSTHTKYGVHLLVSSINTLQADALELILKGYIDICELIVDSKDGLIKTLDTALEPATKLPIRMIFRNTKEYLTWIKGGVPQDIVVMVEELAQLKRGDVPYFFRKISSNNLYWYSEVSQVTPIVTSIKKGMICEPNVLLSYAKLVKSKLPTGVLHICQKLMPNNFTGNFQFRDSKIECRKNRITYTNTYGVFAAKRS